MASPPPPSSRPPPDLAQLRAMMAQAVAAGTWRTARPPAEETLGGVRVLRFTPPQAAGGATVLHLHGGAFRNGCPEMIGPYAEALSARCGVDVALPAYRLAPEAPFPAGLADACAAAQAVEGPLILSGDSAGGGLAASLALLLKGRPLGLVLHSPWLDLTLSSTGYEANAASDPLFSRRSAETAAALYLQGHPADDPLASPLLGDLRDLPPTFVSFGQGEVLADDARRFHAAVQAAGDPAELLAVAGMEHVAVTRSLSLPGAAAVFEATARFIDRLLIAPPRHLHRPA